MGLVCIQNENLLVYSKSQKVSASFGLPFQHSRGKNLPVGGIRPPPGLFRVNYNMVAVVVEIGFMETRLNSLVLVSHNNRRF